MRTLVFNVYSILFLIIFINVPQANAAAISWTGTAGDNLWSNYKNWSTNTVPTLIDEVFINGPSAHVVFIDGKFDCRRLQVSGNHMITIEAGELLEINGQNVATTDLLFVSSDATFENYGTLYVHDLTTSSELELIDIEGDFINAAGATTIVENISFTGTYTSSVNREAINIGNDGVLTNIGIISLDNLSGSGITVNGSLVNEKNGEIELESNIDLTGITLENGTSTATFQNHGTLLSTMNGAFSSYSIWSFRDTEVHNYGTIRVENSNIPLNSLQFRGDVTNYANAEIEVINSSGVLIGFPSSGLVEFLNQGDVSIVRPGYLLSTAISIREGATLNNEKDITISGFALGMSTIQSGNLVNQLGATFSISGTSSSALNNVGEVSNYGTIDISDCGNESYRNLYTTVNYATGVINVINADGWALRNARASSSSPHAAFQNYGELNISALNDDLAIYNFSQSIFRQAGKVDIQSNSKIINLNPAIFYMQDTINAPEFDNRGDLVFSPSPYPYVFEGDLRLSGVGKIDYYISSSFNPRKIKVEGDLYVDGELDLEFEGGYVPGTFQNIDLLEQVGSRTGFFETFTPEFVLPNHQLSYGNPNIVKLAYNACGSGVVENQFLFASGNWSSASNWSLGHVPLPCEEVVLRDIGGNPLTVTMNSISPEIAKLTIFGDAELIIQAGKTLTINREYQENLGSQALYIYEDGKLVNNGTLNVKNVDGGPMIENRGEIENNDILRISDGYNSQVRGLTNRGFFNNTDDGILYVSDLDPGISENPTSIYNYGTYLENGISDLDYGFYNRSDSELYGNGDVFAPYVNNSGIISPGDTSLYDVGDLTITGDLQLSGGSLLVVDVVSNAGPGFLGGHDRLTVTATTQLGGEIEIKREPSFTPASNEQFPFLIYQTAINGSFSTQTMPSKFTGWEVADDQVNKLVLILDESCFTTNLEWTDDGEDIKWTTAKNWTNKILPLACHDVVIDNGTVEIDDRDEARVSSLIMDNSTIIIDTGGLLATHGDSPLEAALKLTGSTIINKGSIILSNTLTLPSIIMDNSSNLDNQNSLIVK